MDNQEFREAYRTASIKHEDAHHTFPFDNCYMPECETAWERMNDPVVSTVTDPKKQLELLAVQQHKFEAFLHELTGLTVKVSLNVHSADNSTADLLDLFDASLTSPAFRQVSASNRTWISHEDLSKGVSIFMPEDFYFDKVHPEPEDDEGYAQAVVMPT